MEVYVCVVDEDGGEVVYCVEVDVYLLVLLVFG